ncbi:MAG: helix-turn-helix domain-containing protein [Actinomycetota bacterium]
MSAETEFGEDLSAALGPLYRISILDGDGAVVASFRAPESGDPRAARIRLPGSGCSVALEVDLAALRGADRVLHDLARAPSDVAIGEVNLDRVLDELLLAGEASIGRRIAGMNREQKQHLVKFLDERGAFSLRKSVETVADVLGVSRFTVYNYLDASRGA